MKDYRRSLTALNRYPAGVLVHGTVMDGVPYAWLDLGEMGVFNPGDRKVMTTEEFRARFQPVEEARYTAAEAWEQRTTFGGWGPWERQ